MAFPIFLTALPYSTDYVHSSVVLWVSQNMEDDYTYNLQL